MKQTEKILKLLERNENGLTIEELSKKMGITENNVHNHLHALKDKKIPSMSYSRRKTYFSTRKRRDACAATIEKACSQLREAVIPLAISVDKIGQRLAA